MEGDERDGASLYGGGEEDAEEQEEQEEEPPPPLPTTLEVIYLTVKQRKEKYGLTKDQVCGGMMRPVNSPKVPFIPSPLVADLHLSVPY